MGQSIVYKHTNINARDWRKLSSYYQKVFNCTPVPPERNFHGQWFERLTNLKGVHVEGEHLALPGYEEGGPTLEIFTYNIAEGTCSPINGYGFAHIAFDVDNIEEMYNRVIREGGGIVGEIVIKNFGTIRKTAKILYATDPEGNIVEMRSWS